MSKIKEIKIGDTEFTNSKDPKENQISISNEVTAIIMGFKELMNTLRATLRKK